MKSINVTIIGAGLMGHGIALKFAQSKHKVTVFDPNESVLETGLNFETLKKIPNREPLYEFDQIKCNNWHMPKEYYSMNVLNWLLDKCQSEQEKARVKDEYSLFEQKKFIKVLQFLIYFVDTLRANNVVWGVGRGSSVSSFCLFLIGVHKINPMLYDLDYKEFLR